jgi:hypothetical protein
MPPVHWLNPCGSHRPKLGLNKLCEGARRPTATMLDVGTGRGRIVGHWTQRDELVTRYCLIRVHFGLRGKRSDRSQREHRMDVCPASRLAFNFRDNTRPKDPMSGRHLKTFPQAFTHLALINAVMHIIRAETTN